MRPIDYYIVEVEKTHEDKIKHGVLELWLPAITDIIVNDDESIYNPNRHNTFYGRVKHSPFKISATSESPRPTGLPCYKYPVLGAEIAAHAAANSTYLTQEDYYPSTAEMKWDRVCDLYRPEAKDGDLVYFTWDSTDAESLVGENTYRIHIRDIIAFGSENTMCHSGHVLCELDVNKEACENGIYRIETKKPLRATVKMVGNHSKLKVGDSIVYLPNSAMFTKIEGRELVVIKEIHVLCKVEAQSI